MTDFAKRELLLRRIDTYRISAILTLMEPGRSLPRSLAVGAPARVANNDTNANRRFVSQL
jgi:hypothetical protein